MKRSEIKAKPPRDRREPKPAPGKLNQATSDEFEREGMGVAPKE